MINDVKMGKLTVIANIVIDHVHMLHKYLRMEKLLNMMDAMFANGQSEMHSNECFLRVTGHI